jgi:hypothetical protein
MGTFHKDGYSASLEIFFVLAGQRFKIAKTSRDTLTFSHPCDLPPGTEGTLSITVDGCESTRLIVLDDGVLRGDQSARYSTATPF